MLKNKHEILKKQPQSNANSNNNNNNDRIELSSSTLTDTNAIAQIAEIKQSNCNSHFTLNKQALNNKARNQSSNIYSNENHHEYLDLSQPLKSHLNLQHNYHQPKNPPFSVYRRGATGIPSSHLSVNSIYCNQGAAANAQVLNIENKLTSSNVSLRDRYFEIPISLEEQCLEKSCSTGSSHECVKSETRTRQTNLNYENCFRNEQQANKPRTVANHQHGQAVLNSNGYSPQKTAFFRKVRYSKGAANEKVNNEYKNNNNDQANHMVYIGYDAEAYQRQQPHHRHHHNHHRNNQGTNLRRNNNRPLMPPSLHLAKLELNPNQNENCLRLLDEFLKEFD